MNNNPTCFRPALPQVESMGDFKITLARIEMMSPNERGEDMGLTFRFERDRTSFTIPIFLDSREFDDTEMVKVARSKLHDAFKQLLSQCEDWQLSDDERRQLASLNVRPETSAATKRAGRIIHEKSNVPIC